MSRPTLPVVVLVLVLAAAAGWGLAKARQPDYGEVDPTAAAAFVEEEMPSDDTPAVCPQGVSLRVGTEFTCEAIPSKYEEAAQVVLRVESELGLLRLVRIEQWPAGTECPPYLPCPNRAAS